MTGLYLVMTVAPMHKGTAHLAVRWLGGSLLAYGSIDLMAAVMLFLNRLAGIAPPVVHRMPILSRSVREFWSERWNLIISTWLRAHCMRPLLRRGRPTLGIFAAFMVSALLHAYFTWVGLDGRMALMMGAFFILQFPIVMVERRLCPSHWPVLLARMWTV